MNKIAFWISFTFLLTVSTYFGVNDQLGAMSLTVLVGAVGMAFSSLDKFSKIKAAGFEAELKRAVEEAYATTSSVKKLALELTEAIIGIVAAEGRWGGMGLRRKLQVIEGIDHSLKSLGFDERDIKSAHKVFDDYLLFDHGRAIVDAMLKAENFDKSARERLNGMVRYEGLQVPTPEEFQATAGELDCSTPEVSESIEDLRYFRANKELRRPKAWIKNDENA